MRWARATVVVAAIGCIRGDLPEVPPEAARFAPEAGGPPGWVVHSTSLGLTCPDDDPAQMVLVHPEAATDGIPVAVVFHSGAFDHVLAPDAEAPLSGPHYASPDRLSAAFATRQLHTTLGQFPEQIEGEHHTGELVAAFTEAGAAVLLPGNCWGDLWGARSGVADSDFAADFFRREGRTAAEWAVAALLDGIFADEIGATVPVQVDPKRVYAVGLGSGGRAVMELLRIDRNQDGGPDLPFAGVVLDSTPDDLRRWVETPGFDLDRARGIARVFPDGDVGRGSVWAAPELPERIAYVYSSLDPVWPTGVHQAAVERLENHRDALIIEAATPAHVQLNGAAGPNRTAEVVDFLMR